MTLDEAVAKIEASPAIPRGALVHVHLDSLEGLDELESFRDIAQRCRGRFEFIFTCGNITLEEVKNAGFSTANDHELVEALAAARRAPSLQDGLKILQSKYAILRRG